jgi:hypothetical protein
MKQGRADIKGRYDGKVEPNPKAVNPGAVSYLGESMGNHSNEGVCDPNGGLTPWSAGRGYAPPGPTPAVPGPGGGRTVRGSGSQGKY